MVFDKLESPKDPVVVSHLNTPRGKVEISTGAKPVFMADPVPAKLAVL